MCHAPSIAAGTSACRSWSSFVSSRLFSALEAGNACAGSRASGNMQLLLQLIVFGSLSLELSLKLKTCCPIEVRSSKKDRCQHIQGVYEPPPQTMPLLIF